MQVWEVLAHQGVEDDTAQDHPSCLTWCQLNSILDDPQVLRENINAFYTILLPLDIHLLKTFSDMSDIL